MSDDIIEDASLIFQIKSKFKTLISWAQGGVIDIESMPENVQSELQV